MLVEVQLDKKFSSFCGTRKFYDRVLRNSRLVPVRSSLGLEILTATTMKVAVHWDATSCNLVEDRRNLLPPSSG
jgi:hypothetical protein